MTTSIFIDSVALVAIMSPRDQKHQSALKLLSKSIKIKSNIITTDYVIDESTTHLITSVKSGFRYSSSLLDWILQINTPIQLIWMNNNLFLQAVKVFQRFNKDKQWSFTDCTSFVVMKELKISTVFTFDDHFEQMGFKILK